MAGQRWETQRTAFGAAAGHYDRIRPRYPVAALRWMLGPAPLRVVDLGAGTGILSQGLHAAGHLVTPVEPDADMRGQLAAVTGLTPPAGSAEAIPLSDGSADAVVAGQAYHWFDRARSHLEIARVLRPGGVFTPVWNVRDEQTPWVAALTATLLAGADPNDDPKTAIGAGDGLDECNLPADAFGARFGPVEHATFAFSTSHTADSLVALIASRSYYLTATPRRKATIESAVRELAGTHPDLRGRTEFTLPYVTHAYRASTAVRAG